MMDIVLMQVADKGAALQSVAAAVPDPGRPRGVTAVDLGICTTTKKAPSQMQVSRLDFQRS